VTSDVKEDTLVILEFLDNFNGEYYIPERFWTSNNVLELFTDAAGNPKGLRRFIAHFDLAVLLFITETNVSLSVLSYIFILEK
jgi:hypothetical protein